MSLRKTLLMLAAVLTVLSTAALFVACTKETEIDRVKKTVLSIQKAAEERDINGVMKRLSRSYADHQGQTYDGVKGLLFGYFFRYQSVSVYVTDLEAAVQNNTESTVRLQAVLTGRLSGVPADVVPDSLGMYVFNAELVKESGDWVVRTARWTRTGEGAKGPQ